MMGSSQRDSCVIFNTADFQENISSLMEPFVTAFSKISRFYLFFHATFLSCLTIELAIFSLFFQKLLQSVAIAFSLAALLFTLFSYLVLLFYLHGRRREKLFQLKELYLEHARSCIPFNQNTLEYYFCITEAIVAFTSELKIENVSHRLILRSQTLCYLIEKLRIWTKWKDLLRLKEMLILSSVQEHIDLIKREPTDLEAHASLASNYVALASLYQDPKKLTLNKELCWSPPEYESEEMHKRFETALERALEEYLIIEAYAQNDPWVHAQRATIYRELSRPNLEQEEYEKILEVDPENVTILFRLGALSFSQGKNAKGLKIYDTLRKLDPIKGDELISQYDAYAVQAYCFE